MTVPLGAHLPAVIEVPAGPAWDKASVVNVW